MQFVSVNVGADDEIQEMAQQAIDFGVEFPLVKDSDRLMRESSWRHADAGGGRAR